MPAGVDEDLWFRAKDLAEDAGHQDNYPYIMSIYKNLKGEPRSNPSLHSFSPHSSLPTPLRTSTKNSLFCPPLDGAGWGGIPEWPWNATEISFSDVVNEKGGSTPLLQQVSYIYLLIAAIIADLSWVLRRVIELDEKFRGRGTHLPPEARSMGFIWDALKGSHFNDHWEFYNKGDSWLILEEVSIRKLEGLFEILEVSVDGFIDTSYGHDITDSFLASYSASSWNAFSDLSLRLSIGNFEVLNDRIEATMGNLPPNREGCILPPGVEMGKGYWSCLLWGYRSLMRLAEGVNTGQFQNAPPQLVHDVNFRDIFIANFLRYFNRWSSWVKSHDKRGFPLP